MENEKSPFENSFFKEVCNDKPFFKCSLQGDPGSGKTYTMAKMAIGLHKKIGSKKPIVMIDTESGNKWLKPLFDEAGIKLLVRESRSLTDVMQTMKMCREGYSDIFMIDSITHIHENFLDSFRKKLGRDKFQIQDYAIIKPAWKNKFSTPLVEDEYHILFAGRIKDDYENEIDKDTGKRSIYKSGRSMQGEKNLGYEPDMLIYMERMEEILDKNEKTIFRQGTILKDRANLIDGKTFKNPSFEDFEIVIDTLLKDPVKKEEICEGDDAKLFKTEDDKYKYIRDKKIAIERIEVEFNKHCPGQSADAKSKKIKLAEKVFNTGSWTEIESLSLSVLEQGLKDLKVAIEEDKKEEDLKIKGADKPVKKSASKKTK